MTKTNSKSENKSFKEKDKETWDDILISMVNMVESISANEEKKKIEAKALAFRKVICKFEEVSRLAFSGPEGQ